MAREADEQNSPALIVARIGAAFGVRGWNHLQSFTDPAENIVRYDALLFEQDDGFAAIPGVEIRRHREGYIVRIPHNQDRDAALAMRGKHLAIAPDALPDLGKDEYYWRDLIGLQVVNEQGERLGAVRELLETGQHDVLVLDTATADQSARLIPFTEPYLRSVDLDAGQINVAWALEW